MSRKKKRLKFCKRCREIYTAQSKYSTICKKCYKKHGGQTKPCKNSFANHLGQGFGNDKRFQDEKTIKA